MIANSQARAWAEIDLAALRHNLDRVRQCCPRAGIMPVVKANGYGHGMDQVASSLAAETNITGFAVATLDEAVALHALGLGKPILMLQGFRNRDELQYCLESRIECVVHADYQVALLKQALGSKSAKDSVNVWLKLDTGMHRLGLTASELESAFNDLVNHVSVAKVVLMSHLACADNSHDKQSSSFTQGQVTQFRQLSRQLVKKDSVKVVGSLAASAGILAWPDTHEDIVRPGIMLYGGSPLAGSIGPALDLAPVMTLNSRLIAIKPVAAGEHIGYGATHTCERDSWIGIASIGYGDGYPRTLPNGTPVLVAGSDGFHHCKLAGRVSMDMITIDLGSPDPFSVGAQVVLWGRDLPADDIAGLAGTISYELFCQVTRRVHFDYS